MRSLVLALAVAAGGCAAGAPLAPQPPPWPPMIEDVAWLTGAWLARGPGGACFAERWFAPAAGSLVGVGRHVAPSGARTHEAMRLMRAADGELALIVALDHGQVTRFVVRRDGATGFTADREGPGWPGRITYALAPDGALAVTLGAADERRVALTFARAAPGDAGCGG